MANVTLTAETREDEKRGCSVTRRSSKADNGRLIACYDGVRFGYVVTPHRGTPADQKVLVGFFDDGTEVGEFPNQPKARTQMERAYRAAHGLPALKRGRPLGSKKVAVVAEEVAESEIVGGEDEADETGAEFGGQTVVVATGESEVIVAD